MVTILFPTDGYQIHGNKKVNISATATDNSGTVTVMRIFVNNALIFTSAGASCSTEWIFSNTGTYAIKVIATDGAGNVGERTITVRK